MADDRTQFLIDLAAKFTGGDAAVVTVATLGDKMLAAGATAESFEQITKATNSALEEAASAAQSAAEAVAAGSARYNEFETGADRAAKMVEKLSEDLQAQGVALQRALEIGDAKQIERAENKVWELAQRQQDMVEKSKAAAAALKAEAVVMDGLTAKATSATEKHDLLKRGLANVEAAAGKSAKAAAAAAGTGKVNEMAEAFGKLGGPAGIAGQKVFGLATGFQKLKGAMGTVGPYLAIAVAIVAVASAAAIAAVGITSWAVSLADANRTQGLLLDGIARTSEGGAELADTIDRLGTMVPSTREELMGMAKTLADTGLRGKELSTQLEATAIKAAKLKFGPDFEAQMLSLDFQSKRLHENIANVFGGLKIDPLLEGLQTLGALFDTSTASGKTLKFLFEAMFQPLVDGAAGAVPKVERLFLTAEIWALKAYLALKPWRGEIETVGKAVLITAAAIVGVGAVAVALLVGALVAAAAVIGAVIFGLIQFGVMIKDLGTAIVDGFVPALQSMTELGANLIHGLVDGITGAAGAVVNAIGGVVTGAIDHAKSLLGIASPSKIFAGIGDNTAAGFAEGVEGGSADAQGALESMVSPPATAGAGGSRAGGGGLTLNIGTINVSGENAKAQALDLIDQITQWLEGEGITLGGGETPA